ncbi:MAG: HAMP domain-containing histidine kinase [Candidatus Dormibacteraeota bacterium]|nr:HAMP domain-containing histidine kinase [Candidatus Dormibacteraeota bacterium]
MNRLSRVANRSIRVALVTTAIVAVLYVVVAAAVVVIVDNVLTAQVDGAITDTLHDVSRHPDPDRPPPGGYDAPTQSPGGHRYGPPQLVFTIYPSGEVRCDQPQAHLSAEDRDLVGPQTINVDGTTMRAVGQRAGDVRIVVAQSMEQVNDARLTLVIAEALVGPLLLLLVFLGALTIGQRVAAPIEAVRRRQLAFTADASHELRTPLSVIEANTSLALHGERSPEWYRRAFTSVHRESERMRHLIEDLLWLARFDSTEQPRHPARLDLGVLAGEAVDRFQVRAEARRLTLDYARPEGPVLVTATPEWLERLLGVLLDNACKYTPEGGLVWVRVTSDGRRCEIAVDDSGPGIPLDQREQIFDRFHRATDAVPGAGLGLAIADAIVHATAGRWRIEDSPLGGASMGVSWASG